jgi:hypothetical protein
VCVCVCVCLYHNHAHVAGSALHRYRATRHCLRSPHPSATRLMPSACLSEGSSSGGRPQRGAACSHALRSARRWSHIEVSHSSSHFVQGLPTKTPSKRAHPCEMRGYPSQIRGVGHWGRWGGGSAPNQRDSSPPGRLKPSPKCVLLAGVWYARAGAHIVRSE